MPEPAKVTPLAVAEILYVPTVVTVAVMVWVTPDTATPAVIVPAEAVEQSYAETTPVPLVEGWPAKHFQLAAELVPILGVLVVLILVWIQFKSVLKMVRPVEGLAIASRCAVVIRGNSIPWLVLTISKAELALGVDVPIPTCAIVASEQDTISMSVVILFFIVIVFLSIDSTFQRNQFVNVIQLVPLYNFTELELVL